MGLAPEHAADALALTFGAYRAQIEARRSVTRRTAMLAMYYELDPILAEEVIATYWPAADTE